jgi:hypothetical protein
VSSDCCSDDQEFYAFMEPEIHHLIHRNSPFTSILTSFSSTHIFTRYFSKMCSNVIFPSMFCSSTSFPRCGFLNNIDSYKCIPFHIRVTCPAQFMFLEVKLVRILDGSNKLGSPRFCDIFMSPLVHLSLFSISRQIIFVSDILSWKL